MIFEVQLLELIFEDAIYSMAVGFIVGFINQFLNVFFVRGKYILIIKDIIITAIFTTLLFSYVVSFANYNILRWYNVLFAFIGFVLFSPCFSSVLIILNSLFFSTIKVMKKYIYKYIRRKYTNFHNKQVYKKAKKLEKLKSAENINEKSLNYTPKVLYND